MVMSVAALTYLLAVVLLRIEEYQKLFGWVRRRRGSPEGWTQD